MIATTNGTEYRLSDTTWGKYDSGFHAWLVEACEPDEYDGDTDFGGCSRFGRRLDYWDPQGFHSLETFKTEQEAQEAFQAWADDFNAPERSELEPRDYRYVQRWDYGPDLSLEDQETAFSHPSFPGVALHIVSPALTALSYRWGDTEYEASETDVMVVMVGDDQLHRVERSDLTAIPEGGYCGSCGQIGCSWH